MAFQEIVDSLELYENGEEVSPAIPDVVFADSITTILNDITITAGATDQVIPVGNKGTIKVLRVFTDYSTSPTLTCKISGQSTTWSINPVQEFNENVTALTITNSDLTNTKVVNVEIISST
jgi:hypothetical protein